MIKVNKINNTISDVIDVKKLNPKKINMIIGGTNTGKSYFSLRTLIDKLNTEEIPDLNLKGIKPNEILLLTSRKITEEQQANSYSDVAFELNSSNFSYYRRSITKEEGYFGSVKEKIDKISTKIPITNYNFFNYNFDDEMLSNIKILIFDEIHSLILDNYNEHMQEVYENIDDYISKGILIIGMTATDDDMKSRGRRSKFNYLLDEPLIKNKITGSFNVVAKKSYAKNIISNLEGKSLVMCFSAKEAIRLANEIPNSRALISRYNELRSEEMNELEDYIIQNKMLPEDIECLFTTSMAREGFEFDFESNIKNIIIYDSNPVNIKQFIGRYRGNLLNLYIINEPLLSISKVDSQLTKQQREYNKEFKNLIYKRDYTWTKHFSNIVDINIQFNIIDKEVVEQQFINYMEKNWSNKLIYTKDQKLEITEYARKLGLEKDNKHKHTFSSLMKLFQEKSNMEFIFLGESVSTNNKIIKKYILNEDKKNIRPYLFKPIEDIEGYLKDLIGQKLYKDEQNEIKEKFGCKQISKLNEIIKVYGLVIESKLIKKDKKVIRIWVINRR